MEHPPSTPSKSNRIKFIVGGMLFFAAVIIMIISATRETAEFFITVQELQESEQKFSDQNLRVSGAVLGDSILYDPDTGLLHFTIIHIPGDDQVIEEMGGMSAVLHQAVNDPNLPQLQVVYDGVKPDMLKNEAQAILTGRLDSSGVFVAEELLLKCPTKYEEALPEQVENVIP
jgi:cytochrome c-type biogenesis protein CcmE